MGIDCTEDVIVDNEKISIKHISSEKIKCAGIKAIWTSNENKQKEFLENPHFMDMLLVFIGIKETTSVNSNFSFKFRYVTKETLE